MDKGKMEDRKKTYKKTADQGEMRRRRQDGQLSLRKAKREENLQKRRNRDRQQPAEDSDALNYIGAVPSRSRYVQQIPAIAQDLISPDESKIENAVIQFRKMLSIEEDPPISEVIAANIVPVLTQLLTHTNRKIMFEASWALTNVASGSSEHTESVVKAGALPTFIRMLESDDTDIREQAIWAIGNIAGDRAQFRDLCLQSGVTAPLLHAMDSTEKITLLRNATWTISNFCRGRPAPDFSLISCLLPKLRELLYYTDPEILTDACWALSYVSDGTDSRIQAIIDIAVLPRVVELMMNSAASIQTPALRTIGNIVTGDHAQTQAALSAGCLVPLLSLICSHRKPVKKEACWTVSNITAGTPSQIQQVIEANLIPPLVNLLSFGEWEVQKEAAWAISNATSGGTPEQLRFLVSMGCIKPLCDLLTAKDDRVVLVIMDGLDNILRSGETGNADNQGVLGANLAANTNEFAGFVDACGGLEKIEQLQHHANESVYEKAVEILEQYFAAEEEIADDPALAPQQAPGAAQFTFGLPQVTAGPGVEQPAGGVPQQPPNAGFGGFQQMGNQ